VTGEAIVVADGLSKVFQVAEKPPGFSGTLRHLLRRRYRSVPAVQEVSFTIAPGEIVGFLGPNGAGKTTTLKMLSGLIHPSAGRVSVAGCVPFRRQERFLQQITLVMGNRQQLLWDLPPLETFRVNAAVYGIDDVEARRRIEALAEMLELGEELRRPVRKLSLGQRMKAELLAALLHQPAVLFLDEPTLGLDVNAQARVRSFLADYNRRTGATVLLTSHDMGDITSLCERVLLIHEGRLFHDGSLEELTSRLAPCREVRLELRHPQPAEAFAGFGTLEHTHTDTHAQEQEQAGDRVVRLLIPRASLTQRVAELLDRFEVVDLEVRDPPIEELIGALFRQPGMAAEPLARPADRSDAEGPSL
jgi:ABC-2 type transport system ATP-binding protein